MLCPGRPSTNGCHGQTIDVGLCIADPGEMIETCRVRSRAFSTETIWILAAARCLTISAKGRRTVPSCRATRRGDRRGTQLVRHRLDGCPGLTRPDTSQDSGRSRDFVPRLDGPALPTIAASNKTTGGPGPCPLDIKNNNADPQEPSSPSPPSRWHRAAAAPWWPTRPRPTRPFRA